MVHYQPASAAENSGNSNRSGVFPQPVKSPRFLSSRSGPPQILGVPTVGDRIAQMVVKQLIKADLDSIFLPDSYGYRPRKSALDAVGVTRQGCWKYDWVLEFDIRGLFDNLPHSCPVNL
jgi:RNA-directed DNA polymerase